MTCAEALAEARRLVGPDAYAVGPDGFGQYAVGRLGVPYITDGVQCEGLNWRMALDALAALAKVSR